MRGKGNGKRRQDTTEKVQQDFEKNDIPGKKQRIQLTDDLKSHELFGQTIQSCQDISSQQILVMKNHNRSVLTCQNSLNFKMKMLACHYISKCFRFISCIHLIKSSEQKVFEKGEDKIGRCPDEPSVHHSQVDQSDL